MSSIDALNEAKTVLASHWAGVATLSDAQLGLISRLVDALETELALTGNTEGGSFFYTTDTPHQWSSGASISKINDDFGYITSLAEAKALAEKKVVKSYGDNRVSTTYGIQFEVESYPKPLK
jgi:hypothetical protein